MVRLSWGLSWLCDIAVVTVDTIVSADKEDTKEASSSKKWYTMRREKLKEIIDDEDEPYLGGSYRCACKFIGNFSVLGDPDWGVAGTGKIVADFINKDEDMLTLIFQENDRIVYAFSAGDRDVTKRMSGAVEVGDGGLLVSLMARF